MFTKSVVTIRVIMSQNGQNALATVAKTIAGLRGREWGGKWEGRWNRKGRGWVGRDRGGIKEGSGRKGETTDGRKGTGMVVVPNFSSWIRHCLQLSSLMKLTSQLGNMFSAHNSQVTA